MNEQQTRPALLNEALGFGGPIIVFDNVDLSFDEKVILRDVSFTLQTAHTRSSCERRREVDDSRLIPLLNDQGAFRQRQEIDAMPEDSLASADLGSLPGRSRLAHGARERGYKLFEELLWLIEKAAPESKKSAFIGLSEFIDRCQPSCHGQRRRVAIACAGVARIRSTTTDDRAGSITALGDEEIIKLRDLVAWS
jgi:hypothetical protein